MSVVFLDAAAGFGRFAWASAVICTVASGAWLRLASRQSAALTFPSKCVTHFNPYASHSCAVLLLPSSQIRYDENKHIPVGRGVKQWHGCFQEFCSDKNTFHVSCEVFTHKMEWKIHLYDWFVSSQPRSFSQSESHHIRRCFPCCELNKNYPLKLNCRLLFCRDSLHFQDFLLYETRSNKLLHLFSCACCRRWPSHKWPLLRPWLTHVKCSR